MSTGPAPLASFRRPPVVEVVLGVQFSPLVGLQAPRVGLLWSRFRRDFPDTEELPALEPAFETFGTRVPTSAEIKVGISTAPPPIRFCFVNQAETELVQVQRDRFVRNWRKRQASDAYPRYDRLRVSFESDFRTFLLFVGEEGLGELLPNQCEVTYVDVLAGEGRDRLPELSDFVAVWSAHGSDRFLPSPEEVRFLSQYVITAGRPEPAGRLYCSVEPALEASEDRPIYLMRMTARGQPRTADLDGIMTFFDLGHEWIVRDFTSITAHQAHQLWERQDGD